MMPSLASPLRLFNGIIGSQTRRVFIPQNTLHFRVLLRFATTEASTLRCLGCGVTLQPSNPQAAGFVPQAKLTQYHESFRKFQEEQGVHVSEETSSALPAPEDFFDDGSLALMKELSCERDSRDEAEDDLQRILQVDDKCTNNHPPLKPNCQRCYRLAHYSENKMNLTDRDHETSFIHYLEGIRRHRRALIVFLVDVFNFPLSFYDDLSDIVGSHNQILVVANKTDLLPLHNKSDHDRLAGWVRKEFKSRGMAVNGIHLVSTKSGAGVNGLLEDIQERCKLKGIPAYIVGCVNVGKSSLLNFAMDKSVLSQKLTESPLPGTTLEPMKFSLTKRNQKLLLRRQISPYGVTVYDTPGILHKGQVTQYLTDAEVRAITPTRTINPITYSLKPGQTLLFGGLGRLDYVEGDVDILATVFTSKRVSVHPTNVGKADEVYERHAGSKLLSPPYGKKRMESIPQLEAKEFNICGLTQSESTCDITLSELGWVALTVARNEHVKVKGFTPAGTGLTMRPPLIPRGVQKRGRKAKGSRYDNRPRRKPKKSQWNEPSVDI